MSLGLRIILIILAVITMFSMFSKIRKSQMLIDYTIFWILFSILLVILAIFPQIAFWASSLIGIQSPANFVFALILFILLIKNFMSTIEISTLKTKIKELTQKIALKEHEE